MFVAVEAHPAQFRTHRSLWFRSKTRSCCWHNRGKSWHPNFTRDDETCSLQAWRFSAADLFDVNNPFNILLRGGEGAIYIPWQSQVDVNTRFNILFKGVADLYPMITWNWCNWPIQQIVQRVWRIYIPWSMESWWVTWGRWRTSGLEGTCSRDHLNKWLADFIHTSDLLQPPGRVKHPQSSHSHITLEQTNKTKWKIHQKLIISEQETTMIFRIVWLHSIAHLLSVKSHCWQFTWHTTICLCPWYPMMTGKDPHFYEFQWWFPARHGGTPSHHPFIRLGVFRTKTIQLWGYSHVETSLAPPPADCGWMFPRVSTSRSVIAIP